LCLLQLITCADNSSIGAWDIETGRKAYMVLDAHDGEEITCIAIDRQCRRIATGARNGVIKVRFYLIDMLFFNLLSSRFGIVLMVKVFVSYQV